jgi:prephenate dehydrogenase
MKVGIVGGTGRMGRFFADVFEREGCEVAVAGRRTSRSARHLASECDIIMVSVPIRKTIQVIREIAPLLNEGQLFCDLTSLKTAPVNAMLESAADVIGLHPMFGPTVTGLRGQTIIATPARCTDESLSSFLSIFEREGGRITITTPEEHDRMMAIVQGLTHFVTLSVAETMRRAGVDPRDTTPFTSPVYQIELGLVGRLLAQDQSLYADILQLNPFVLEILDQCEESVRSLRAIVGRGDPEEFGSVFLNNARHFGTCTERGMRMTDELIQHMVNR